MGVNASTSMETRIMTSSITVSQATPTEPSNKCLQVFCSQKKVDFASNDLTFWEELCSLESIITVAVQEEQHFTEAYLKPFELSCHVTGNYNYLQLVAYLKFVIHRYCDQSVSIASIQEANKILGPLLIVRVVSKYLFENQNEKSEQNTSGSTAQLFGNVVHLLSVLELNDITHDVHLEAMNLLIVLMSAQMFSQHLIDPEEDTVRIALNHLPQRDLAGKFVLRLIMHYIQRYSGYSGSIYSMHTPQPNYSYIGSITSIASSVLLLPWRAFSYLFKPATDTVTAQSPIADKSLLLLLLLTHRNYSENSFRVALAELCDISFGNSESTLKISLSTLYDTISSNLTDDRTTLLLYFLLHTNKMFLAYVLSRTDLDTIVIPLLQVLYGAVEQKPQQIYMILIILLILSQDPSFSKNLQHVVPHVPWLKERHLVNSPLGSIMVVVLVRTVVLNLSRLRDVYLHSNCLATLANLAPHLDNIHPYAAYKLIKLFELLSKKHKRATNLAKRSPEQHTVQIEYRASDEANADFVTGLNESSEMSAYADFMHMVLKILNSTLTHNLPRNPHLVYALLYQQNLFEEFKSSERYGSLIGNLEKVITFFNNLLDKTSEADWTADKVLDVIKHGSHTWKSDFMAHFVQLQFKYEEEDSSEEFFAPYVWCIAYHYASIPWKPENIKLFSLTDSSGSLEEEPTEVDEDNSTSVTEHAVNIATV